MPLFPAVVTLIGACSSATPVWGSPCELESSGGIEVPWVSWRRWRRLFGGDVELCFGVGRWSPVYHSQVA